MGNKMIILSVGAVCMGILSLLRHKQYGYTWYQAVGITVILLITGVAGTKIMAVIEGGTLKGQSFYGAVFLIPLAFWLGSFLLRYDAGKLLSFCAPSVCIILAVEKASCLATGCCAGFPLFWRDGYLYRFPSQILEMINALVLMCLFLLWEKQGKHEKHRYTWFILLYGITRLILNCCRDGLKPWLWILPCGHVWSICSAVIGLVLIYFVEHKAARRKNAK